MRETVIVGDDKVKNLIIQILSEEWPLTAKKIYYRVKRKGKSVTYQAVFKALTYLVKQRIVDKNNYNYSLNKKWLSETANFYENIKKRYLENYKDIPSLILKKPSLVLTFDQLYKMMVVELNVLSRLNFLTKKDGYTGYGEFNQLQWPFAIGEKEHDLLLKMFRGYKKMYVVCGNKNTANSLIYDYYKTLNKNVYLKFNKKFGKEYDMFVGGNIVAQIYYTDKFKDKVNRAYLKVKNLEHGRLSEVYKNIFLEKTKITVVITRILKNF